MLNKLGKSLLSYHRITRLLNHHHKISGRDVSVEFCASNIVLPQSLPV